MPEYRTVLSEHCFYGNLSSMLRYYGMHISEAELVLLCNSLNCVEDEINKIPGIPFKTDENSYKNIGCTLHRVYDPIDQVLAKGHILLLAIDSSILHYHHIYENTNRLHFIVLLSMDKIRKTVSISDSFVPAIPRVFYEGDLLYEDQSSGLYYRGIMMSSAIDKVNTIAVQGEVGIRYTIGYEQKTGIYSRKNR